MAWRFFYRLSVMSRVASLSGKMVAAIKHGSKHAEIHGWTARSGQPRQIFNHPQAAKQVDNRYWSEHGEPHLQAMMPAMPAQDHPGQHGDRHKDIHHDVMHKRLTICHNCQT